MTKIDSGKDWTFEELDTSYEHIRRIAVEKFQLDYYPNQIEIITSEQMLDAYSAVGLPIYYSHWSFGKQFVVESEKYKRGQMGLAYEIVINSNPCISYLMEENSMAMQCLVMAHACFGHNSFFKNNVTFKQWTDAEAIIDFMAFAKHYITECEEKYGEEEVELVLDAAHSLRNLGIDRYSRPAKLSTEKEKKKKQDRAQYEHEQFDDIWRTLPTMNDFTEADKPKFPSEPEENLLYFIEKHVPNMEQWKKEIIRIIRKIAQYFYPQQLTQIMNEGFATFFHYHIVQEMYEQGLVTDGFMIEFLISHTSVIKQQPFARPNPYALGFAIYQDIKRISIDPTEEDRRWFPDWAGNGKWLENIKFAAYNFKDESFIMQYLSPKVMRDFAMFYVLDDDNEETMIVKSIQNDEGYRSIREKLAEQHNINNNNPVIQVVNVDVWGDRTLTLEHRVNKRQSLEVDDVWETLEHLSRLWGYDSRIVVMDLNGEFLLEYHFDAKIGRRTRIDRRT